MDHSKRKRINGKHTKESYAFLRKIVLALLCEKFNRLIIDYRHCRDLSIGAQVLLDIILRDAFALYKQCKDIPVIKKTLGINKLYVGSGDADSTPPFVEKILFSVGSYAIHRNERIDFPDILPYPLCTHDRGANYSRLKAMERKDIDTTALAEYVINSLQIEARHNGLGASPGSRVIAVHPTAKCFQHLVIPVGAVVLDTVPSLIGLNSPGSGGIAGSILSVAAARVTYGYISPTTLEVSGEFSVESSNTPYWIAVSMPVPLRQIRYGLSAYIRNGGDPLPAVAKRGEAPYNNHIIVGPGNGVQWTDGAGRIGAFQGKVEILT